MTGEENETHSPKERRTPSLLSVLLLDPSGHVHAPGDGHEQRSDDVLRVDAGGGQLVKDVGLVHAVSAGNEGEQGERAKESRGDLLADAEHRRGGCLSLPVGGACCVELEGHA